MIKTQTRAVPATQLAIILVYVKVAKMGLAIFVIPPLTYTALCVILPLTNFVFVMTLIHANFNAILKLMTFAHVILKLTFSVLVIERQEHVNKLAILMFKMDVYATQLRMIYAFVKILLASLDAILKKMKIVVATRRLPILVSAAKVPVRLVATLKTQMHALVILA